ncbi:MAG: hypothetical protein HFG16_05585 [Erysipelotrichaceae bacterium]|nr:hypothetical protein [Erysipelotrichaceae bacterium]
MITIDNQQIMVEHYKDVIHVASDEIHLRMKDRILMIRGKKLQVCALSRYEILIEGKLESVMFGYET